MRTGWVRALASAACVTLALLTLASCGDPAPATSGGPPTVRRITKEQYAAIVGDIFGSDIKIQGRFDPDVRESGLLAIGTSHVSVTPTSLEQYDSIARSIAAQVVDERHRRTLFNCRPASMTTPDDACAAKFLGEVGRQLYRRPLTQAEQTSQVAVAAEATKALGDFYIGIETSLTTMLESPRFLFREEVTEVDPSHPGEQRLTAYSKATRLSFFLWNTAPDDDLLASAENGDLNTERGLGRQVDRMLASPRLRAGVRAFFSDMLGFDAMANLAKDPEVYPKFTPTLINDAQEQTLRTLVDHLLMRDGDYRDVFTTRRTYLTQLLGAIYRVPVQVRGGWEAHEYPDGDPHAGIVSQVSFLALHSHPGRSSSTLRGKAVREILLCQPVPTPPANVNFAIVQDTKNATYRTARERLSAHRTQATCAGCHKIIDPIGLSLENFDGLGGYRQLENGAPIDSAGELDAIKFDGAEGLGKTLHDAPAATACLVNRLYDYGAGRAAVTGESDWMKYLQGRFAAAGYRLPDLLRTIAISDAFYKVAPQAKASQQDRADLTPSPPSVPGEQVMKFTRRTALRGMLGGSAVSVGLPFLDCFLDMNGTAIAATGAPLPIRFGTWFWGCGLTPGRWIPQAIGAGYDIPAELKPLAAFKEKLTVFSGFKANTDGKGAVPHYTGSMSILTGSAPKGQGLVDAPTLDTMVADTIGAETRFRSLEVTATGNPSDSNSRRSSAVINASEPSPLAFYQRLFGPEFKDPNAANFTPDPRVMVRKSALSAVKEQRDALLGEVGAADRTRLDEYFTSVRQLEQQLDLQLQKPEPLEACKIPGQPGVTKASTQIDDAINNHRLLAQLLAQALACNQTKVFNVMFSDATSSLRKAGSTVTHHQLTHEEPIDEASGCQPQATFFVERIVEGLQTMLTAMDSIREGDGTLLDHMLLLAHSECSFAKVHSLESIPMLIAGRAGGKIKSGLHVAGNGDPVTRVGLTIQQVLGVPVSNWGAGSMLTSKSISEIMA